MGVAHSFALDRAAGDGSASGRPGSALGHGSPRWDVPPEHLLELGRRALFLAHDVNAMLSVARVALERSAAAASQGRSADPGAMQVLEAALARASALLEEVLHFGARPPLRRRPVAVAEVVRRVARLVRTVATLGRCDRMVTERYDAAPVILGDEVLLESSLTNLAFNAYHAAQPCRGRDARLDFAVTSRGGETVVTIYNSTCTRLLRPEALLEGPSRGSETGHGLGLIIARTGIEAHGGRLVLESDDGGVRATVLLPAPSEQTAAADGPPPTVDVAGEGWGAWTTPTSSGSGEPA